MGECDRPSPPCRLARSACRRCQLPRQTSRATPGAAGCVGEPRRRRGARAFSPRPRKVRPAPDGPPCGGGSQAPVCVTQPERAPPVQGRRARALRRRQAAPRLPVGFGGRSPGAQAAGAGNPVESKPQANGPQAQPKPVQRPAQRFTGFPAPWMPHQRCPRCGRPALKGCATRPGARDTAERPARGEVASSAEFAAPMRLPAHGGIHGRAVAIRVRRTTDP